MCSRGVHEYAPRRTRKEGDEAHNHGSNLSRDCDATIFWIQKKCRLSVGCICRYIEIRGVRRLQQSATTPTVLDNAHANAVSGMRVEIRDISKENFELSSSCYMKEVLPRKKETQPAAPSLLIRAPQEHPTCQSQFSKTKMKSTMMIFSSFVLGLLASTGSALVARESLSSRQGTLFRPTICWFFSLLTSALSPNVLLLGLLH
ncbi:hypothetical protein BJ875DRAFT_114830 [Amylocarpus encephaloides]|uniref:Uncharacterized protein n=1 Tax=Amylocarpus encephaloides TaxID=45428 RepID=A0A9P8C8M1_9HELO|nr:hypothetical protein BJ875DRAFT_114830 [Amylocarpus encephaloides]